MKRIQLLGTLGIILLISMAPGSLRSEEELNLFGPKTYMREKGKPRVIKDNFPVSDSVSDGLLLVQNGYQRANRVSSGVILLNGLGVVGPSDFNKQVEFIGKPVSLEEHNEISVELRGKPGSFIVVTIFGVSGELPPDPSEVAPPVDESVATTMAAATEFLYSGPKPIQIGVVPGIIDPVRAAVVRGRVMTHDGEPLSGVRITILNHPEYGQTLSRVDGMFDMAVNGGGLLMVRYEKGGYLTAQRKVEVPWQDFAWLPDVALIPMDPQVTVIDFSEPIEVARGSVVTDGDGTRQATLLFPQGTAAEMVLPDGSTQPLSSLSVRATEYSVGPNGPNAMADELPPTSGYTYCVEFTADEAMAARAKEVRFDHPIYSYVEDFIGFPVGGAVPAGYYDRQKGQWIASENGRVIEVLSISGGLADLDTDGDGAADDPAKLAALDITNAERQRLATLYPTTPQRLWRVPITHFTPWDYNWPYGPPEDAEAPAQPPPDSKKDEDDTCEPPGCTIDVQNQALGEEIAITGTPFSLHYRSNRVSGRLSILDIPVSGASLPASLNRIDLEISIAGRGFRESFDPAPNLTHTFVWDRKDAYGRFLQGAQDVWSRIGYRYSAVYQEPAEFAQSFGRLSGIPITGSISRQEITLWQEWRGSSMGFLDSQAQGLGGWTLNVHHAYDPKGRVLYLGDGRRRSAQFLGQVITTVAGTGVGGFDGDGGPAAQALLYGPRGVAVGPDGTLYIADTVNHRIRRVGTDGIITTVAGTGEDGFGGDGGPATQALLSYPVNVAVGPDASLYIADSGNHRIRRVGTDGIITTVAGTGEYGFGGDGGPATQALLAVPLGAALGLDGSLYIAEDDNHRIRRVGTDGIITTVAGTGEPGFGGDGGPATQALFYRPTGITVGPDGSLYIPDTGNQRIRRVGTDGIITTVAGTGEPGFGGDGGPATQALLFAPRGVAVGPDGCLDIAELYNSRIRRVGTDGIITTVAGGGDIQPGDIGDGGPATQAWLFLPRGVTMGADGGLYIADTGNNRIRRVEAPFPGYSPGDVLIAAEDGSEVYVFTGAGRHLQTINALTGALRYEFTYDDKGFLVAVTDGDGNTTVIERDSHGNPVAIVGPYGQRITLSLDADGYLESVTNPANEVSLFTYKSDGPGLLETITDPRGNTYLFTYDARGRLIREDDPAGGSQTLARTDFQNGYEVTRTTALGRTTKYRVERLATGGQRMGKTLPDGRQVVSTMHSDGSMEINAPDGTVVMAEKGPDPRFGMQAPIILSATLETLGGLTYSMEHNRQVTLSDQNNPLSLLTLSNTLSLNGRVYSLAFDASTNTIFSTSPEGRQLVEILDSRGRIVEKQAGGWHPIKFTYDERGRMVTMTEGTDSEARSLDVTYDDNGNPVRITDPLSRSVEYEHDPAGRIIRQVLPGGREIQYSYDARGNLTSVIPPGRTAHGFGFTPVNLPQTYDPPSVGPIAKTTTAAYNADRQLTRVTRPANSIVDIGYDESGHLASLTLARGSTNYTYDPDTGNLSHIAAPDSVDLLLTHDGFVLTGESWSGPVNGTVSRVYNNDFRIGSRSINGDQTISLFYDNDGFLTQAGGLTIVRDAQNGLAKSTSIGNVTDTRVHNGFRELEDYTVLYNGTEIFETHFTRDKLGRIIQKTEIVNGSPADTYEYTYDIGGRLIQVSLNQTTMATYTYDDNGNRLTFVHPGGSVAGSYDAQDRLTEYGITTYTYTENGELQTKTRDSQTTYYSYDALGNLVGVTLPDGKTVEYIIDGTNRRIGKKIDGTLVKGYLYKNGLKPIAELDGSNNIVSVFVYGTRTNVPDYMVREGTAYRMISDHVGSVRLTVDVETGQIAQRMDYDEFGNVLLDTNPGFQPFGFAGGLYDTDTKIVRFGVRDYDPETGRWTAKDPVLFFGGNTNLYVYAFNDPVNFIDRDGRQAGEESTEGTYERTEEEGGWQEAVITPPRPDDPNIPDNIGDGPAHVHRSCVNGTCQETIWDPETETSGTAEVSIDCEGPNCGNVNERAQEGLATVDPGQPPPTKPGGGGGPSGPGGGGPSGAGGGGGVGVTIGPPIILTPT